jgi:hypothetical protein
MDLTIEQNGIRLSIEANFDLDLTFVQDFMDSLIPSDEFEFEFDDVQEEVEYDEEGTAWWYDAENDEWYFCEGDEDEPSDWVLYEEDSAE